MIRRKFSPSIYSSTVLYNDMFDPGHEFPFDPDTLMRTEAVLVWRPRMNWQAAISSIKACPTAAAFPERQRSKWNGSKFVEPGQQAADTL